MSLLCLICLYVLPGRLVPLLLLSVTESRAGGKLHLSSSQGTETLVSERAAV